MTRRRGWAGANTPEAGAVAGLQCEVAADQPAVGRLAAA
jgi:hypothetical protein